MSGKIIVTHDELINGVDALMYVKMVMADGLVSKGRHGEQYCSATTFRSKTYGIDVATVYADKTKNGTHVFRVEVLE